MAAQTHEDPFRRAFGPPAVPAPPMHFTDELLERQMTKRLEQIGSGWFLGSHFYLFGEGLERLAPCVEAWSFLLPAALRWQIIGFNSHGAILLLDGAGENGALSPVGLLDPLTVTYFHHANLDLWSLLGDWMPNGKLKSFLDTSVYQEFLKTSGRLLGDEEILGIRKALPLGGEMKLDNFEPINIVDYYRATGPAYAAAYEQRAKGE
jgi:hypothetical protein